MDMMNLTDEQQAIVQHPMGKHARVLAVAGSGKTTTMVARIKYLVEEQGIDQQMIDVYMFNADAADHFRDKLSQEIPGQAWKGNVHTFHAVALGIIHKGIEHKTIVPYRQEWLGEAGTSTQKRYLRSIIKSLVHDGEVAEGELTAEEALRMIGLWKSSMIAPNDAEREAASQYAPVYEEFERKRREVPALTFDDFVPVAVNILDNDPALLAGEVSRRAFMIIDEYQDINEGQQRLMKLLAGDRSDVMVVGDDDQTIYEWRGAQPEYILSGFDRDFAGKPVVVYPLSHSFRFGPLLAQSAYNVITENSVRATKELVAHDSGAVTEISIIDANVSRSLSADSQLAQRMSSLLHAGQVPAKGMMTLGRTYAQMEPLEVECLKAHVPFLVPKKGPFFARAENLILVDYMRLALSLDVKVRDVMLCYSRLGGSDYPGGDRRGEAAQMVLSTINAPRRYVARDDTERAMLEGSDLGWTIRATLEWLSGPESPIERVQARFQVGEYLKLLVNIVEHMEQHPGISAGTLMSWILDTSGYTKNPPNAPAGDDDNPDDLDASVKNFVDFAGQTGLAPAEFIDHLSTLDTTCGKPEGQCVVFTSIHRAKGLEADYIFLPGCNDGVMPVHLKKGESKDDLLREFEVDGAEAPDDHLESERRLFYVAMTRACKQLYIGTGGCAEREASRSPFIDEMQLDKTRVIIEAFLGVLRSKTRDADDAACRSFVRTCAGLPVNEKVARYARDHYVDQLNIPSLRQRVDDAAAHASADHPAVYIHGDVATVTPTAVRSAFVGQSMAPWQEFYSHNPDWGRTADRRPAAGSCGGTTEGLGEELYHVTRITNLPSIFVAGLLCWRDASRIRGFAPFPDSVVQRRLDPIALTGEPVTGYISLSLCARSPFLHKVTREDEWHDLDAGERPSPGMQRDDEIVTLTLDARRVVQLPGTIYSSLDACSPSTSFYEAREFPAHINWSAIRESGRTDAPAVAVRAAAVLVPGAISAALITSIAVHSETALRRAKDSIWERLARHENDTHELPRCMHLLRVDPESFFPQNSG